MKVNTQKIFFVMMCFACIASIHLPNSFKLLFRLLLLAYVIFTQNVHLNPYLIFTVLYSAVILISTATFDGSVLNLLKTFSMMAATVICAVCVSNPINKRKMSDGVFIGISLYFIIDAYFIFAKSGLKLNGNEQPLFFSGGKFSVCYIYLLLMILFFTKYQDLKSIYKILIVGIGIFLAQAVDCNTGLLGILAFAIILLLPEKIKKGNWKYIWFFGAFLIHYLIVIVQIQSKNTLIQYVITNILHRSTHLTGRTAIYDQIPEIMEKHWILGYGYTSERIQEVTGLANTQNGFLQILYTGGIVALVIYCGILIYMIHCLTKMKNIKASNVLFAGLIAYLVIAIVEIPFNSIVFQLLLCTIYFFSRREKGENNVKRVSE